MIRDDKVSPTMTNGVKDLVQRINRDRLDRRMTWPNYAKWMGVPQSTIYKLAMGRISRPHDLTVDLIEKKLLEPKLAQQPAEGNASEVVSG